jgi:alkanesulfonate monooxygenase SsuD/methylene tetrahydromethanopterin reductase-like flavin-dependent oxidoreductase (luciferase family)
VQDPFELWLGGMAPAALRRCGRLADGWLPALCTPEEAAAGRDVVSTAAGEVGRSISPEHFGVSVGYATGPLAAPVRARLAERARGQSVDDLVPVGHAALRDLLERFVDVGFSKFVLRPVDTGETVEGLRAEFERLAAAVGDLQT